MVGQRLQGYLQSCGLEAADVPKVVGSFMMAKYSTWATFVFVGIRAQPLRRLVRPRPPPSWLRRHHLQLMSAWDRAKERYGKGQLARHSSSRHTGGNRHASSNGHRSPIRKQLNVHLRQSWQRNVQRAKASNWYGWASEKYWYASDMLSSTAQKNRLWSMVAAALHMKPGSLALGLAEGTILFKLTFPLTGPLSLWLIVCFFRRHAVEEQPEPKEDVQDDSYHLPSISRTRTGMLTVMEAARDVERLADVESLVEPAPQ
mmetsp:Transcript_72624/g.143977  ORF Transcript_72624/g.143977 Transcript_72624/m.143977 type:complete len:259 (-) Transcript_72624:63-839(-)